MHATLRFSARMRPLLLVAEWRMPPAGQQCHDRLGPTSEVWTSNLFRDNNHHHYNDHHYHYNDNHHYYNDPSLLQEGHEMGADKYGWPRPHCGARNRAMHATLRFSARMRPFLLVA